MHTKDRVTVGYCSRRWCCGVWFRTRAVADHRRLRPVLQRPGRPVHRHPAPASFRLASRSAARLLPPTLPVGSRRLRAGGMGSATRSTSRLQRRNSRSHGSMGGRRSARDVLQDGSRRTDRSALFGSPMVGQVPVEAGTTYRVELAYVGRPVGYPNVPSVPYTVETALIPADAAQPRGTLSAIIFGDSARTQRLSRARLEVADGPAAGTVARFNDATGLYEIPISLWVRSYPRFSTRIRGPRCAAFGRFEHRSRAGAATKRAAR